MSKADEVPGAAATLPVQAKPQTKPTVEKLPPFNVVLLDDDDHSYDYVIEMLGSVCNHSVEKAYQLAKEVDSQGRVIVLTTHKEKAELKAEQIQSFGADARISRSKGGMSAVVEPAE